MNLDEHKMNSELKKLDVIEKDWNNKLDKEISTEEEILTIIEEISNNLMLRGKTRAIVNKKSFIIGSKIVNMPKLIVDPISKKESQIAVKTVVLVITNEAKYALLNHNYVPATVKSDCDNRYDAKANIRAAVEGWVRHITDSIKPEMLEG